MTEKTITFDSAVQVLHEIVEEAGRDTKYDERLLALTGAVRRAGEDCKYQVSGKPMCIVGVIFDRVGVPYSNYWEGEGVWSVIDTLRDNGWTIDDDTSRLLTAAQEHQDAGETWGEAEDAAIKHVETVNGTRPSVGL